MQPGLHRAGPTLALTTGGIGIFGLTLWLTLRGDLPVSAQLVMATLALYLMFTVAHESVHRNTSPEGRLDEVLGRIASLLLLFPFPAFRVVHLEHHRHTNHDPEDPDAWSARGPRWLLPLRWLTQDLYYYPAYLRLERPLGERLETAVWALLLPSIVVYVGWMGSSAVWTSWVIPQRLTVFLLAILFDYLPHRPHHPIRTHSPYAATRVFDRAWLTPLLLGQNYHLIHHLWPRVPFHHYTRLWRARRGDLAAHQAVLLRRAAAKPSNDLEPGAASPDRII